MADTLRYLIAGYLVIFVMLISYGARLYLLAKRLKKERLELEKPEIDAEE